MAEGHMFSECLNLTLHFIKANSLPFAGFSVIASGNF